MKRPVPFELPIYDFSGGIIGNLSDYALGRSAFLVRANNLIFVPTRGTRSRDGSRELCSSRLAAAPHSLSKYLPTTGTAKLFVGHGTSISLMTDAAITAQSLPLSLTGKQLRFAQLNDVLFAAEHNGAHKPIAYLGTAWAQTDLQVPAGVTSAAATAGGSVDAGAHHWRVRNRYLNGCSVAFYIGTKTIIAGTQTVPFASMPSAAPGGRTDWLGWVLERTKANDPLGANGIYYEVATGTAAGPTDAAADSTLWNAVRDTWYNAPLNFNGTIPHFDRMFGWEGTFLWPSWSVGGDQYTGIFNYYPLLSLRVGADDGDIIMAATPQGGRLVIFKNRSMHFLEGVDEQSWQVISVPDTGGVAGPRACCTVNGSTVIHYNSDGLWITTASTPKPFGWNEISHYLAEVTSTRADKVALFNIGNRFFVMSYSANGSAINNEAVAYDFNTKTWAHFTNFYVEDAFLQEDTDFSSARTLAACGLDITGASGFNCLSMLDGSRDLRASVGTGGVEIPLYVEIPRIDMGSPRTWKNLQRIEVTVEGGATEFIVRVEPDAGPQFSFSAVAVTGGKDWCEDVATHPDDLEWDVGDWAVDENVASTPTGIPGGMLSKRFRVSMSASTTEQSGVRGLVLHGSTRPERKNV